MRGCVGSALRGTSWRAARGDPGLTAHRLCGGHSLGGGGAQVWLDTVLLRCGCVDSIRSGRSLRTS